MDGIVLINKPIGVTSYDVVRKAKKVFKTKKIGHTGTLDPFAEGLIILCVNKATKLVSKFIENNKTYIGEVVLNNHYDTYDTTGTIIKSDNKEFNKEAIIDVLKTFKGEYYQEPPMYSALKKDGKKLYEYAREGITIKRDKRLVNIYGIDLLKMMSNNRFTLEVSVSKGTYIRSLAVDIANKLNTYGALNKLKRTKVGNFSLQNSTKLEDLKATDLIPLRDLWSDLPRVEVSDYIAKLVRNGIYLDERQTTLNRDFVVVDKNNNMLAYYDIVEENKYKPVIILGDK